MYKIFKYEVTDSKVNMPKDNTILRMEYVDDGFYKGDFVWAIVNTNDKNYQQEIDYKPFSLNPKPKNFEQLEEKQLKIKEKQEVYCEGVPLFAEDYDGKLYVYSNADNIWGWRNPYNIVFYKTGQAIDEPIDKLQYLGINKMWIMQELGLYTFLVKE